MFLKPTYKPFPIPEPGAYPARCYQIVDLGTQESGKYEPQRKVLISFELVGTEVPGRDDHIPFTISTTLGVSFGKKAALRAFLKMWRGRDLSPEELSAEGQGVDFLKLLGAPIMLSVVHNQPEGSERIYANIGALMPVAPKTVTAPGTLHPVIFALNMPDWGVFEKLPPWLQEKIAKSPEYVAARGGKSKDWTPEERAADRQPGDDETPF